jgi:PBSX family phage portal protein
MSNKVTAKVVKAENSTPYYFTSPVDAISTDGIVQPPYPISELQKMMEYSTILYQCVEAYKHNIVGFGVTPAYTVDLTQTPETTTMKQEWDALNLLTKFFSHNKSFTDVFAQAIEDREVTGNAYLEILRNGMGQPEGAENLNPVFMKITKLTNVVDVPYNRNGKSLTYKKQFRRFVFDAIGMQKIWFKEFGDPRIMDSRTGEFNSTTPPEYQANEILHLKLGNGIYGVPRWIGHLIHMYGSRKAEELNYRYFTQGRHTPLAIMLSNAQLSEESEAALLEYAQSVEGTDNAHKFLVIESESLGDTLTSDGQAPAKVELKSLADMLQQDALFLEYDAASREKVQSSFRLPDLYIGRSKDFNRATANTARHLTEEQVFEPERNKLESIINDRLFAEWGFLNTQLQFRKPEISDMDQMANVLKVLNEAGAVTPNDLRDLLGRVLGKELENLPNGDTSVKQIPAPTVPPQLPTN